VDLTLGTTGERKVRPEEELKAVTKEPMGVVPTWTVGITGLED